MNPSSNEALVRGGLFFGALLILVIAEHLRPRRPRSRPRGARWANNLGLVALDQVVAGLLVPLTPVAWALVVRENGWGLLPPLHLPAWADLMVALVLLDLAIYLQHVLFHRVPVLWRFHRMHHADVDLDASSGLRFHPVEILISVGIKLSVVTVVGATPEAVLVFAVVLNVAAMFNHANLALPLGLDRVLRTVIVTPDMHRVHHSTLPSEHHQNFGFNLPWWDYLFGTYTAQPSLGHEGMVVGLDSFRAPEEVRIDKMLTLPFREDPGVP